MDVSDYKGVWVFAEQRDGKLQKVSLELLGEGREIAEKLGESLTAVLLGHKVDDIAEELIYYGADNVLYADNPLLKHYTTDAYTKVVCDLAYEKKPGIIFFGGTYLGKDLAPRVAARLSTGITADCTELNIDFETKNIIMTKPAFGGNLMATIVCEKNRPQILTVKPGVFTSLERDEIKNGKIENVNVDLNKGDIRVDVEDIVKISKDVVDIGESNVIVAGGRGVDSKEGFKLLSDLAKLLGGTVAGSRAAIESGLLDKEYQVGQTGKTVRPNLYIAVGISGAIQHLSGMKDSDYIIAINKDKNAAMMKVADLGIVGDYKKVIPALISQIK